MKRVCISKDWTLLASDVTEQKNIDLPHDFSISLPRDPKAPGGGYNGFFQGGKRRYLKFLDIPQDAGHIILDIDGAYMQTEVTFNEHLLNIHHHGYTPFLTDLTEKMRPGLTNKLLVSVTAIQPSTRWYSGGGLYRDVFLWTGGEVRIEPRDIFVTTERADEAEATVKASYVISSDKDARITLSAEIKDENGVSAATESTEVTVKQGEKTEAALVFKVTSPKLWDTENPNLYKIFSNITLDGAVTDTDETTFGIRTISADAENGFLLNGKPLKLHGGCVHHTHGVLGAADFPAAVERRLKQLKAVGFNAIRSAHNPPSINTLELCDKLGVIIMDEAFDMWRMKKCDCDYHLWFDLCWDKDIERMVKRDRNHPSVISYSIGNEILERSGRSDGYEWSRKLSDEIRKYDNTRFVTAGICGMWSEADYGEPEEYKKYMRDGYDDIGDGLSIESSWAARTEKYIEPLDIAGYNYLYPRYAHDHKLYPKRVIWGSETVVMNFYDSWKATMENSHVIGDFTWTAYDNLGENGTGRYLWARDGFIPGISVAGYDWIACYQGDYDLCGYRRPQSYFREAIWKGCTVEPKIFTTHPEHYGEGFSGTGWHWYDVSECWTFEDKYIGKPVKTEVYTLADEAVWFLNGKEVGRAVPEKAIATVDVPYEKGTLSVILYKDGKECGKASLHTGEMSASTVNVVAERAEISADNRDLCYFDITLTDKNGDRVPFAENELHCIVSGGELMGIFSANPKSKDYYTMPICHAYEGRAVAIVRTGNAGAVEITVGGEGLVAGKASVKAI